MDLGNKYYVLFYKFNECIILINLKLYFYLCSVFVLCESIYGMLLDIYGMGILIIGKFGVGKLEIVLELIKRNYILVVDDRVDVYEIVLGVIIG